MKLQAAIAVGGAVIVVAALAGSAQAVNSQTYQDSLGENPDSPDITSIVVSNDDTGLITWKINISNRPALTQDMAIPIYLDTDQNANTGDKQSGGAEYAIELDPGQVTLFKWNGSDYVVASPQTTLTYVYDSTGATIKINASELGGTKALNFLVLAFSGITTASDGSADFSKAHGDSAPDPLHGTYAYRVLTVLKLTVASFVTSPSAPKAGATFSTSLAANENDTGGPVEAGTVTCSATLAGTPLAALKHAFANGVATCSWKIPKTAKRKAFKSSVTLTVRGATATRRYAGTVK